MQADLWIRRVKDHLFRGYYLEKYLLKGEKKHPVAIICPGGGYELVCSFAEGLPYAKKLNQMGYSAIVVHYRCGKKHLYPTPQDDLARAVREIWDNRERWNLDMDGYSLWGASAGGHLAASFGTSAMGYPKYDLPKPGALILSYPVITMEELTHKGSRRYLLGTDPTPETIRFSSVEQQLTPDYPPTFLWTGLADGTVNPLNSRMLTDALQEQKIPHRFLTYEGVDHGVGIGEGLACEGWFEEAVRFWEDCRQR